MKYRRGVLRIALLVVVVGAFVAAYVVRGSIPLGHNAESVRRVVAAAGYWGPPLYVCLFAFRSVLLVPSVVLLTAGGICFGVLGGMIFGAMGLTFSALLKFVIAHLAGREKLIARLPTRMRERLAAVDKPGSIGLLGFATAYPVGPAEVIHIAAILSGMRAAPYLLSIGTGSLVRAGSFSLFGDSLVEGRGLVLAALVLLVTGMAPFAMPRFRRRLRSLTSS